MPNARAKPTFRRRRLGSALKRYRLQAGLTLEVAATAMKWDAGKMSRIENARAQIRTTEVAPLLKVYGQDDPKVVKILEELAKTAGQQGWWQTYSSIIHDRYDDYMDLEWQSTSLRGYSCSLIHGLLQTTAYAREVIAAIAVTRPPDQVEALAQVRLARQAVLTRPGNPLKLWTVVHETALRQEFRSNVMVDQLQRLLDLSELPTVTIQVMPADARPHPGLIAPFDLVTFPEPWPAMVNLENVTGGIFIEDGDEVDVYDTAFKHIVAAASPVDVSRGLIEDILTERKQR